jgi:hypothetical protein
MRTNESAVAATGVKYTCRVDAATLIGQRSFNGMLQEQDE